MLAYETGTCSGSDLYFFTPSELALQMLYYPTACGYYFTDYAYQIQRENANSFLLFYVCKGRLSVKSGGSSMVATEGQIGFINCHVPHEYHSIGDTEFLWIHLDGLNAAQLHKQIVNRYNGHVFGLAQGETLKASIYEIISACRTDVIPNEAQLSYKIYGMLIAMFSNQSLKTDGETAESPIERASQFIKEQYHRQLSLSDIAKVANISPCHFSRRFKKEYGYSPYEFMIMTRIRHAMHLLKTTDLPIHNIAQTVGYHNVETFTNTFTKRVGLAPSQFRKYPI